jgi:hypothetical protein
MMTEEIEIKGEKALAAKQLFPEDSGELTLEARRVLNQLLSGPSIDRKRHQKLWQTLLIEEEIVKSRLSELFLSLAIANALCPAV